MRKIIPSGATLLPDNATCVYEGNIFSTYTWPQAMFDGTVRQFEMIKRSDTVKALVIKDDKVLIIQDEQPGHIKSSTLPGGRVDPEDTDWLSACKREVQEETGLTLASWKLIDVRQPVAIIEWFAAIYIATDIISEAAQNIDKGGEKIDVTWQSYENVRLDVISGATTSLQFLLPLFNRFKTIEDLLTAPEYIGQEVDR